MKKRKVTDTENLIMALYNRLTILGLWPTWTQLRVGYKQDRWDMSWIDRRGFLNELSIYSDSGSGWWRKSNRYAVGEGREGAFFVSSDNIGDIMKEILGEDNDYKR